MITETVLKKPITTLMVFLLIIIVGVLSLLKLPLELMPNYSFGQISIITSVRGGLPAEFIERMVTKPIEEAVSTVSHLERLTSISKDGRSTVVLDFEAGTDMNYASLDVREKFAKVKNELPREVEKPIIAKFQQDDIPIMILAVTGQGYTPEELREIVKEELESKLKRVNGVARVEVFGGRERKILIEVNRNKLQSFRISIDHLVTMVNLSNFSHLAGKLPSGTKKFSIRTLGEFENLEDIKNLGIATTKSGSIIKLKDVAEVKDSYLEAVEYSRVNTKPVVSIYIQKESLANTLSVIKQIKNVLSDISKKFSSREIIIVTTKDDSEFIKEALNSLKNSLLVGTFLALLVLFIFFRNLLLLTIIAAGVPITIFFTLSLMYFTNLSLNVITLSGLALGVGMIVDTSIIVLENIVQRRKIIEGTKEVSTDITASTITTIVVFIPLIFINPEIRRLYSGIALTIIFALICSLFISQTLVPLMFQKIGKNKLISKIPKIEWQEKLNSLYKFYLLKFIRHQKTLFTVVSVLFAISFFVFLKMGKEFIEPAKMSKFTVHIEMPAGTRIELTDKITKKVEQIISQFPEVETISSKVEKWSADVFVTLQSKLKKGRSKGKIKEILREKFDDFKKAFIYFKEAQEIATREIFIELYGYDYETLKNLAKTVSGVLSKTEKFSDIKIRMKEGRPVLGIKLNKKTLEMFGLNAEYVARNLHTKLRGLVATRYRAKSEEIETIVRIAPKFKKYLEDLDGISFLNQKKTRIFLGQVSEFERYRDPTEIWHRNKIRMVQVSADRGKMPLSKAGELVKKLLENLKFPEGYSWQMGYNYKSMIKNKKEFSSALILVLILIYMVLASLFESYSQPLIIMVSVPLSLIGSVILLKITGRPISVGVWIGLMMLGGIVINNAILLLNRINSVERASALQKFGSEWRAASRIRRVVRASVERLKPILITTLTTLLGVLPLALNKSGSASLWAGLAITLIGGLIVSAGLTLFFVPAFYLILKRIVV